MAVQSKVAVVLVGGGIIAAVHAPHFLSSTSSELVAIVDPFPSGQVLAQKLSVKHFPSVEALLAESAKKPELYVICVPSALHVQVATDIINTAEPKVIMVEKPFCTDSASGLPLLDMARSKGCKVAVGHHRRFHAIASAGKELIRGGKLGDITAISGVWAIKKNDGCFDLARWRRSRAGGGGPVWINFVHDIDLLQYFATSRIVRIWTTGTVRRREFDDVAENDRVEEGAAIMLQFASGVVGTFLLSDNVASPFSWESGTGDPKIYAKADVPVDCYRFFGTKGTLSLPDGVFWSYPSKRVGVSEGVEIGWHMRMNHETLMFEAHDPYKQQAEHLVQLVSSVEEPLCSGSDGLAAVKVCEAVIEALNRDDGQPVDIK